jgi:hypothetical protein
MSWEGFANTRDLGGLPRRHGGTTRYGAVYRSATVDFVTARGWQQAYDAGVRTVIDLRYDDEVDPPAPEPAWLARRRLPLEGIEDTEFWRPLFDADLHGTPLYYDGFLRRQPGRVAAVMTAIASAEGGVVYHCSGGRDRTGLMTLLLLALVGVDPEAICEDYALVDDAFLALSARLGRQDDVAESEAILAAHGTDARQVILQLLAEFEPANYLRSAGVPAADIDRLRNRLAAPQS